MTGGDLAARLVEAYALATVVLAVAALAMRLVRQPARRITAARAALTALAAVTAVALTRDRERTVAVEPAELERSKNIMAMCCPVEFPSSTPPALEATAAAGPGPWPWIAPIFATGSAAAAGWLALGAAAAACLRARLRPADSRLAAILARVAGGDARPPALWVAEGLGQPIAFGLVRPAIALPDRFTRDEPEARVEAAIAHERAHLRNGDLAWLAASRALLVVFYAHPLFHMIRRRIRLDQEAVADAEAARCSGRIAYAEALLSWSSPDGKRRRAPRLVAAIGLCERPSTLSDRVALLLDGDFRVEPRSPARWRLGVALAAALLVGALAASAARFATPVHDCANCTEHLSR